MNFLHWLLARLKEPSTYAGLSGLALAFGVSTELYTAASTALAGAAGLIAVVLADRVEKSE
jgi:Flp pilus assembly protein protease CpaA